MFGFGSRRASKEVRKRAKNINQIRSSRDASEQAIFMGNTRKGQDAWDIFRGKKESRGRTQEERKQIAGQRARSEHVLKGSQDDLRYTAQQLKQAANDPNLTPEQRKAVMDDLRAQGRKTNEDFQQAREFMKADADGAFKGPVDYTTGDRAKALGTAVGEYYLGGSGKQMAARMGGTVGGIVGLNVGMDALDDNL